MLLKYPQFSIFFFLVLCVYSLHEVKSKNKNYRRIFKTSLPRSVLCLKVCFLKRLKDMNKNTFSKDQEAIEMYKRLCAKTIDFKIVNSKQDENLQFYYTYILEIPILTVANHIA